MTRIWCWITVKLLAWQDRRSGPVFRRGLRALVDRFDPDCEAEIVIRYQDGALFIDGYAQGQAIELLAIALETAIRLEERQRASAGASIPDEQRLLLGIGA